MKRRIKTAFLSAAIAAMGISLLTWMNYTSANKEIQKGTATYLEEQANSINRELDEWAHARSNVLETLRYVIEKNNVQEQMQLESIMGAFRVDPDISDVYIGMEDGAFYSGTKWVPPTGYDPRIRPWYIEAMKADKINYSAPYLDMMTGKLALSVGTPLRDPYGKPKGIIAEDILLDTIINTLTEINFGGLGYPVLIDKGGIALYHPDRNLVNTDLLSNQETGEIVQTMFDIKNGEFDYFFRGDDKMMLVRTVGETGWTLGLTIIKENTEIGMKEVLNQMMILSAVIILVIFLSVYILQPHKE